MFCQKCGKENPDNAAFCNSCGADLRSAPVAPIPQPETIISSCSAGKRRKIILYGVIVCIVVVILIAGAISLWNNQDWNSYCSKNYPGSTYNSTTNTCENPAASTIPSPAQIGPHAAPIYQRGDIVSTDNEGGGGTLIEGYNPANDTYVVTWVDQSLDGTWYHGTDPTIYAVDSWDRVDLENKNPYKIGTVDPNNLPSYASSAPLVLTGNGDNITEFGTPQSGAYIFTSTYSGQGNFVVWIKDSNGYEVGLAANTVDASTDSKMVHLDTDTYYAEVTANGPWTLTITPPS
ncbi:hypothetical protein Mboo_0512 [Methanoregula boonei 6A8]|jgi:hypothetical protein|uniref:Zinc-ribbon domain-containing protein n=1 Tax=Methanoregula boonei (strain DSM 21154 / JCM 14090 / 6A8) TaxID=456442 RepID=A7I5L9_METB6|nr:zinc ribbon domain-containing protein [Methanoregula boonei]ABS55030.1 hypothetical protein Mboo_0512 [Methanoregula boonei 6A8]